MAVSPGPKLVLLLLLSCGLLNSSPLDLCPEFCTCQSFLHLNCSSAGLSFAPLKINPSVTELDLSKNHLGSLTFQSKYYNLQKVWLGNNSIAQLSLCVDMDLKGQSKSRLRRRWGCQLWAPALRLLFVERNQLEKFPEGLGQQRSLQILHLSFNKISELEQRDFSHLKQLEELHLQHNLISSLHPQIFDKLDRLKVLDLSFNLLTTVHPATYLSLHYIGADVGLRGNSLICDCGMRFLQRHNNKNLKTWSIECASPLALSGMNLQELEQDDLQCQDSDIHQDVTVHRGSEILLTCSDPDAAWWTPNGETTRRGEQGSLFIADITEQDEGLYVCISKSHQILSLYNVQMHEQNRRIRSVDDGSVRQTRNTVPQSRFALAVSLSVIITFIIAFILGVLLQPYICICCQKIKTKKQKPQTDTEPNVQQEQYDNDAYLHCEDVDDFEPYRERRVTFTEYTEEENNMQYYDTVAGDAQEGNRTVIGPGQANSYSSGDSSSESSRHNHENVNKLGKKIQFEIIPDSIESHSISSQSSKSSVGDHILKENCSMPNATQAIEEKVQKTTIDETQISIERPNEIPGFSSEPFADWSPHGHDISIVDPDLDDGEQFEYSDSVRSGSPMSPNSSFKQPNLNIPNIDKKINFKSSSSSSDLSDSEPTHYTVNPDSEGETHIFQKKESTKSSSSSIYRETENHQEVTTWPVVDLEHVPTTIKRRLIFKTLSVDSYNIDVTMTKKLHQTQPLPVIEQKPPTIKKRRAPLPPPHKSYSSSSESEDEIGKFKEKTQLGTKQDLKVSNVVQESSWPVINLVGKVKRYLAFKVRNATWGSLSSSGSQEERIYEEINDQIPIYSQQEYTTATTEIKHGSGTSSSSESDDEGLREGKPYQENILQVTSPNKQPIMKLEQESQWPVINLATIPQIKQRLEIKERVNEKVTHVHTKIPSTINRVPQRESGTSSSSESENEHETKEVQENYYEDIQLVASQIKQPIVMLEQESQWPVVDLNKVPKVKRRLDLKTSKPTVEEQIYVNVQGKVPPGVGVVLRPESDTSSSSESEGEQEIKVNQEILLQVTSPTKPPTAVKPDPDSQWPVIDLVRLPKVKQRLDIKKRVSTKVTKGPVRIPSSSNVSKQYSGTSSSSESEEEQEIKVNQEILQQVTSPIKPPTAVKPDPGSQWPVIDLVRLPKVKQRLDIKKRVSTKVTKGPVRIPSSSNVSKQYSGTSSSSESEEEQEIKVNQEILQQVTSPIKPPTAVKPDPGSQWPVIDLVRLPKVKQRLDIKKRVSTKVTKGPVRIPSSSNISKPYSGTSSSSESEEEQEIKVNQEILLQVTSPIKPPTAVKPDPGSQWPVIDLIRLPKVKRRLDIKKRVSIKVTKEPVRIPSSSNVSKQYSGTSSSSESEEEQEIKVNQEILQQVTSPTKPPTAVKPDPDSQWPVIDLVRLPKVKQRLDIKKRVSTKVTKGPVRIPSSSNISKQYSGTSSCSESEEEQEIKVNQEILQQVTSPIKPPTAVKPDPDSQWPVIDLVRLPKVKQRLDIKKRVSTKVTKGPVRIPSSSDIVKPYSGTSSSSESEEEQEIQVNQEILLQVTSPIKPPTAVKPDPGSQWPVIDLVSLPKVKQRLDIKKRVSTKVTKGPVRIPSSSNVSKQYSGTSSSSESEEEQEIKVNHYENIHQVTSPTKQLEPQSQWPVINLVTLPKLKQRLDIKTATVDVNLTERVPSATLNVAKSESLTSSSSESEDERLVKVNQVNVQKETFPIIPPAVKPKPQRPVVNLVKVHQLKRRLDIKTVSAVELSSSSDREGAGEKERVPSTPVYVQKPQSDTSSSSESEDELDIKKVTKGKDNLQQIAPPTKQPTEQHESKWPVINLFKIPKVKRRLDIKKRVTVKVTTRPERVPSTSSTVTKQYSGTSSSSESEEEQDITVKHYENIHQVTSPTKQLEPQSQWPLINLVTLPKLQRRLDIKTTKPDVNFSSSSSDSEDERVNVTQVQGKLPSKPINVKPYSGTSSSSESEDEHKIRENVLVTSQYKEPIKSQWPVIDMVKLPKVKRRLDIKERVTVKAAHVQERVPSIRIPKPDSVTSSSESDDEQKIKIMPPTVESQWPVIDLVRMPKVKQRLDIKERVNVKVTPPPLRVPSTTVNVPRQSDTSSSSESEDEEKIKVNQENLQQIVTLPNKQPAESQWAVIDLVQVPKVKQRLDIKTTVPETSSSSSDSEDEKMTLVQDRVPSTNITIQRPTLGASFSSESDDDTIQKVGGNTVGSKFEPQVQWPVVDLGGITRNKRRLDFKIPSESPRLPVPASGGSSHILVHSSSSSSDEDERVDKRPQISAGQTTGLVTPHISRRLDIKGPSMEPDSSSSSDDEKSKPKLSSGSLKSQDNKHFIKVSPILNISRGPTKTTPSIELEKYRVVTDDMRDDASGSTSPVVTPELQSKWATMNLGRSRFRKRLQITKTSDPPPLPSSPPPGSPKQDNLITDIGMVKVTEQVSIAPTRAQKVDSSSSSESHSNLDSKYPISELDSVSPQVNLTSIPHVKRSLNITTMQKKHSSSSSSDEDKVKIRVPNLSLGVPRIKQRLNIKAPTPPPSPLRSDDEKLYAHKFSDVTDQYSIEYKRTIMKSYSDSHTTNREMYRQPLYAESNPQTPKKLSLDNIKRKLRPSKQNELPPNLRWTSVGSHLAEHPIPIPKRQQDSFKSPPRMASSPPISKHNSSDSSSSEEEQKEVKTTLTVTQKTYNPRSVTLNTLPTIMTAATFEDGTERRGLRALKAMSSERKYWDSEYETFTESAPVSVDDIPEHHTVYRRTVDVKTKISQPLTYSTISPASDERSRADMLYGIPSYKRHTLKSTELPQSPPPPIPSTPPPEESADFTWRSPQTSLSRGSLTYVQKKTTEEESVDDPFYNNPNISAV